jgi:hypothetical protein
MAIVDEAFSGKSSNKKSVSKKPEMVTNVTLSVSS